MRKAEERDRMGLVGFHLQNLMLKNNEARVHRSFKIGCTRAFCVFGKCQKIMKNQAKKSKITQKNKRSGRGPSRACS